LLVSLAGTECRSLSSGALFGAVSTFSMNGVRGGFAAERAEGDLEI
jgi:hypothetical protein